MAARRILEKQIADNAKKIAEVILPGPDHDPADVVPSSDSGENTRQSEHRGSSGSPSQTKSNGATTALHKENGDSPSQPKENGDQQSQPPKNGSATSEQNLLELKNMPGPWPSLPFIGTSWQYLGWARYGAMNIYESNKDKYRRYGPVVKEEFEWGKPVVQLFDPKDFEKVFQGRYPLRRIMDFVVYYRRNHPEKYESAGLANALNDEWAKLRKILNPVIFQRYALSFLITGMNSIGDDFAELLRHSRDPDTHRIENFQDYAYRMALEGVYMMSLDTRLGCLDPNLRQHTAASDMIESVKLLFEAFHELFYMPPLWKLFETESYRKLDRAESLMYEASSRKIQEMIEKLRNDPDDDEKGVLRTLIKNNQLSDQQLIVSVIDLISGGIFTVANSLSFLVYHIARNPEVQDKLFQELASVMIDSEVTNEALSQLPYLKACIDEAFRLTPTIPCVNRILTQDIICSGYKIPKGTEVFCNFPVPCMQPDKFPEPERFNPDRWLSGRPCSVYTLLPFGYGSRTCIGKHFALMEMYTALAKLVYNFKLEYVGEELELKSAFIIVPANPISVILSDR